MKSAIGDHPPHTANKKINILTQKVIVIMSRKFTQKVFEDSFYLKNFWVIIYIYLYINIMNSLKFLELKTCFEI